MKNPLKNHLSSRFSRGVNLILLYIIIKICHLSRGKMNKIERIEIYRDVGPVAHSETDGVCRAEVGAGVIPALTPPLKVGGGSRGAKPTLDILFLVSISNKLLRSL